MLCKNKQIEDYDALIYGFPVPYSAKHYGGERFNTSARYISTAETGVNTYTACEYTLCKLVPTSMFCQESVLLTGQHQGNTHRCEINTVRTLRDVEYTNEGSGKQKSDKRGDRGHIRTEGRIRTYKNWSLKDKRKLFWQQ